MEEWSPFKQLIVLWEDENEVPSYIYCGLNQNFFSPSFPWFNFRGYLTMAVWYWHGQYSFFGNVNSQHNFYRDLEIPQSTYFFVKLQWGKNPSICTNLRFPAKRQNISVICPVQCVCFFYISDNEIMQCITY